MRRVVSIIITALLVACGEDPALAPQAALAPQTDADDRRGPKGDQGERGPQGERGEQGPRGERGEKGDVGEAGDVGAQGATGEKGDVGATGVAGASGAQGEKGEQGIQGIPGGDGLILRMVNATSGEFIGWAMPGSDSQSVTVLRHEPGEEALRFSVRPAFGDVARPGNVYYSLPACQGEARVNASSVAIEIVNAWAHPLNFAGKMVRASDSRSATAWAYQSAASNGGCVAAANTLARSRVLTVIDQPFADLGLANVEFQN